MKEKRHVCRRCGAKFKAEDEIPFCPYCREIVLSKEDEEWMPLLKLEDIKKRLDKELTFVIS
jgi:DNA-directed RNA polymerase subunit RPC12/RpoP